MNDIIFVIIACFSVIPEIFHSFSLVGFHYCLYLWRENTHFAIRNLIINLN